MQLVAAILFVASAVVFRLVTAMTGADDLQNFAPMVGIAFCTAMILPWRIALPVTFGALLVSDLALNAYFAGQFPEVSFWSETFSGWMLVNYSIYAAVFALGFFLSSRPRSAALSLGGTIAGVLLFYVVSNTGSWLSSPQYAKTLAGWWQAQTIGTPGFPPSLVFLRNQLIGNTIFASLFFLIVMRPRENDVKEWSPGVSTEA